MRPRLAVFVLVFVVLAGGCRDGLLPFFPWSGRGCTLIGCVEGLAVFIDGAPLGPWTVEARADSVPTRAFQCSAGIQCTAAFFPGTFPAPVTVTVTREARTATHVVVPDTLISYPNGVQCGPGCRTARIVVPAP